MAERSRSHTTWYSNLLLLPNLHWNSVLMNEPLICDELFQKYFEQDYLHQIFGTGQLNREPRICIFFVGMKWTFQNPPHIS
jgi:hypothetical protein